MKHMESIALMLMQASGTAACVTTNLYILMILSAVPVPLPKLLTCSSTPMLVWSLFLNSQYLLCIAFYNDPFLHYWNNYLQEGFNWNCGLCNITYTPPPPPVKMAFVNNASCTCLAARFDYLSRYPDVEFQLSDPVTHYIVCYFGSPWTTISRFI